MLQFLNKGLNSLQGLSRVISPITLKKIPITTAFIKETVRLSTILDINIPRKVAVDIKLPNGEIMPAGTQWTIDIQRMGQVVIKFEKTTLMAFSRPSKKSEAMIRSSFQIVSWMVMPIQFILIRTFPSRPADVAVLVDILPCKS